jgi:hypothetical protein
MAKRRTIHHGRFVAGVPADMWTVPTTTLEYPLGTTIFVEDPQWHVRELIYLKAPATAINIGTCCTWDADWLAVALPVDHYRGLQVGFALTNMAASTFGWFVISGKCFAWSDADLAADATIGVSAATAGQISASAQGHEIVAAVSAIASSATGTYTVLTGPLGSYEAIIVHNTDHETYPLWLFPGCPVTFSASTINAAATIVGLHDVARIGNYVGHRVTLSHPSTAVATPHVTETMTWLWNDATNFYNVVQIDRPYLQGQEA